jgi:outer membrane protein assembly factor BamB
MAVIELDRPVAAPGRRRQFDRRTALTAVILLCASVVTGSARPAPATVDRLWSVPAGRAVATAGARVFVLTSDQIRAYDRETGRLRWSRPMAETQPALTVTDPGALLVPVGPTGIHYLSGYGVAVIEGVTEDTVALDPATGTELWRRPGAVVHATGETTLLVSPGATLRQVRTADGAVLWSDVVDGAVSWSLAGSEPRPARIVADTVDGQVVVLRLADGTVVSRGDVPGDAVDADAMVYANRTDHGWVTVTAYSLDSLTEAWQATARTAGGRAHRCGIVVCFSEGGGVDGLDPATGRLRWWTTGWTDAVAVTGQDRLVASAGARTALLDSATGAVVADLGAGVAVWDQAGATPWFFLRPAGPGQVTVDRLDARTGRLSPRGLMPAGATCTAAAADRLVCTTAAGRLAVFSA